MKFTRAKKTSTPATLSAAWEKVDIVAAGTDSIRAADKCETKACRRFLPQEECETEKAYQNKLSRAVLQPFYSNALSAAVGVVCGTGLLFTVGDEEAEFDQDFLDNVDGEGSTFEMYVRELNYYQMHHGVTFCFIDKPGVDAETDDPDFDLHRPYLSTIKAPQITEMEHRRMGAVEVMTLFAWEYNGVDKSNKYKKQLHIVIDEECDERPEEEKQRYLEYSAGDVVWTLTKTCNNKEVITHGKLEDITRLPIITIIGNKLDSYLGSPLFEDQCDMNCDHYQMTAALRSNLYMTSAPMRVVSGVTPTKKKTVTRPQTNCNGSASCGCTKCASGNSEYDDVEIGPNKLWWLGNKDAKISVLESNGAGAESISKYLIRLEEAMDKEIANFTVDRASVTATETVTKTIEVKSTLETVKDALVGGINEIIKLYKLIDGSGDEELYVVSITTDIQAFLDSTTKEIITEAFEAGIITKKGYAETLQQFLPEGVKLLGLVKVD